MNTDPEYRRRMVEWAQRQVAKAPPLTEAQKDVIRTAFAADRIERRGVAS